MFKSVTPTARLQTRAYAAVLSVAIVIGVLPIESSAQVKPDQEFARVNPTTVTGLAALTTVVPLGVGIAMLHNETAVGLGGALLAWGWIAGPAPFNLYYGDKSGGLIGLGVRGGSVLAAAALVSGGTWDEDGSPGTEIALLGLFAISGVTTVFNFIDLPGAVGDYNERRMTFGVGPTPDGATFHLSYRF